jgi:hypothetical protein
MSQATLECADYGTAELAARINPMQRRGLLAAAGAIVGGLTVLLGRAPAEASHECLGQPHCCSLATCTWCRYSVSRDRFNCSEFTKTVHYRRVWSCSQSGRLVWCGECTTNKASCWNGSFGCSIWYYN